jgi:hypothetical protein
MRKTGIALVAALALLAGACSSRPVRSAAPPPPPLTGKAGLLVGIWLRPVPAGIGGIRGLEGMQLRADGSYRLIGITSMTGVKWRLQGDDALVLSTNTAKYPEPFESKLTLEELTATTLRLSASADYLAGTYHKEIELPRE